MKKKLLSENASYLYESLIEGLRVLEEQNKKLKDENILYKGIEKKLEVSNRRNIRYEEILNLTPGTPENKVELLEYFASEVIPYISEKIESKYTSKIIEYIDRELLNKEENIVEGRKELHDMVLGTDLEFLCPYLIEGYISIDIKTLKSFIRNPSSLAFKNWKKSKLTTTVLKIYKHLSCPIYSNSEIGIHNTIAFSEECINDLLSYFLEKDGENVRRIINDFFLQILESTELKRKYGLSAKAETLDINQDMEIKRDATVEYLRHSGLI